MSESLYEEARDIDSAQDDPDRHTGGKFQLYIHTGNAAFDPDPAPELARLLRATAAFIDAGASFDMFQTIRDINGNDVGRFALKRAAHA